MQIASILKELRLSNGLTQKELASKLGIGQSTIVGYERGEREPTINNLALYAKHFNVSVDYLLGLEDDFGVKPDHPAAGISVTAEEKQLIEDYRSLNLSCKKLVKQTIETLKTSSMPVRTKSEDIS